MPTINQRVYAGPTARQTTGISSATSAAATACCCAACTGLQCLDRTRFFAGQLLSEADLNNEQSYWLAKSRLHNRYLHGWGVVCGMQVVCGQCDGWVTVKTGYALDPCGNDIIVCADQPFDVIQAIQKCCAPAKQAANCSPLRYTPSPSCKDAIQQWCITIQYREQPSRLVTPLTSATSQSSTSACGCGCNGGSQGCGCGSHHSTAPAQTSTSTVPAGTCEATRIVEGFQLGVVPAPEVAESQQAAPGTLLYQIEQCSAGLLALIGQAPDLSNVQDPQVAYQITVNYVAAVNKFFAMNPGITRCQILDDLAALQNLSGSSPAKYLKVADVATYTGIIAAILKLLVTALIDCVCFALVPPCEPDPCDNRLILACVTVQDGKILDICHFNGRKQIISLHTLHYWLGPLGLDKLLAELGALVSGVCCGTNKDLSGFRYSSKFPLYQNEMLTSAGVSSSASVQRIATHYLTQALGASVVNSIAPGARAVDLRPMVGMQSEMVQSVLKQQGFSQVLQQSVDDDPSWSADTVAASAQFAPAAVSAGQRLTVYTKGSVAVGFSVVDPTTAKIQDLQAQLTALQDQLNQAQNPSGAVPNAKGAKKA